MQRTFAYIRKSLHVQDTTQKRYELEAYAKQKGIEIDEFIETPCATARENRQRRIGKLLGRLKPKDRLIVSELSQLGRNTGEVVLFLNQLVAHGVTIIFFKEQIRLSNEMQDESTIGMINMLNLAANMERNFIAIHKKKAIADRKKSDMVIGKPKGTIQASIYDKDRDRIEELLELGLSQRKIIEKHLGYGTANSLSHYIRTRGINSTRSGD